MILDFDKSAAQVVPHFKGGEGEAIVRKFDDPRMGAVVRLTLPVGSSIGLHTHTGNCEVIYILSGSGQCIDDDTQYPVAAGMCHYCPEGHTHSIVNTGDTPLELLGVLPHVK